MTSVQVEAAVLGRRRANAPRHELFVALPPGMTSLRALVTAIVRAEVAAFETRARDGQVVRVLTEAAIEDGLSAGAIRSGGREVAHEVDVDAAVRAALEAHLDGLFQVVVAETPVDRLDDEFELRDGTSVMFLRLVPLAGG